MASVDGTWNCTVKSPLGDQHLSITVRSEGDRFTGIAGGVAGDTVTWKQSITVPMPMTLDCEATVEGDTLTGSVGAGAFGSFPLKGTRG